MKLDVPGASINYDIRGAGPLLLISQSGEGDAGRSTDLVDQLVADYTVVTYDRRGLSASRVDNPAVTMKDHAHDVHLLLAAITDEPALMLGCSLGAVIGLHVAADHPGQLGTLVAHEPVAPWLLPAADAAHHREELVEIQGSTGIPTCRRRSRRSPRCSASTRTTPTSSPISPRSRSTSSGSPTSTSSLPTTSPRSSTTPARRRPLPVPRPGSCRRPGVPRRTPCSTTNARSSWRNCSAPRSEFPGGHNGNTTHPRAYAARLREVLEGPSTCER